MEYFKVKNWDEFQHYKDRNPPWIKLHSCLLTDYDFSCLQDASKLQLMLIWLLASQTENKIPADPEYLKKILCLNKPPDLKVLIDKGFLEYDSGTLADSKQNAILEESRGEAETEAKNNRKKFIPPSKTDVIRYFTDNGYAAKQGVDAFDYYDVADWKDSTGKQVKNWKQKMRGVWFKDENKRVDDPSKGAI